MLSAKTTVEPFYVMDVFSAAEKAKASGAPVIFMVAGQPAAKAPAKAIETVKQVLDERAMSYTEAQGVPELRIALARHYQSYYGCTVNPDRILVTNGSSAAFNLTFITMFRPGDTIAIARPGYPAYRNIIKSLGLNCLEVELGPDTNFTLTPAALEQAEIKAQTKIDGVLLASPANPTGTVTAREDFLLLANWCQSRGTVFISDEIYHGLTFSGAEVTGAEFDHDIIIINSFSKYYCMTGWRIGWMILPEHLVRDFECLAQNMYISAPDMSQVAAQVALEERSELEDVRKGYERNRALLMDALPAMGLDLLSPMDGAFYAYVDVTRYAQDSAEFAKKMLEEIHIAAVPGRDFDPIDGHKSMRFSYAGTYDDMTDAMQRMKTWLQT